MLFCVSKLLESAEGSFSWVAIHLCCFLWEMFAVSVQPSCPSPPLPPSYLLIIWCFQCHTCGSCFRLTQMGFILIWMSWVFDLKRIKQRRKGLLQGSQYFFRFCLLRFSYVLEGKNAFTCRRFWTVGIYERGRCLGKCGRRVAGLWCRRCCLLLLVPYSSCPLLLVSRRPAEANIYHTVLHVHCYNLQSKYISPNL